MSAIRSCVEASVVKFYRRRKYYFQVEAEVPFQDVRRPRGRGAERLDLKVYLAKHS
jgi:hypothetical protein